MIICVLYEQLPGNSYHFALILVEQILCTIALTGCQSPIYATETSLPPVLALKSAKTNTGTILRT